MASPLSDVPDQRDERLPIFASGETKVFIADRKQDFAYIGDAARSHPFGLRRALVSLVAMADGDYIGAFLADRASESDRHHAAQWRLFRDSFVWVNRDAVSFLRLYSAPRRWHVHEILLSAGLAIAPQLVDRQLTVVQGVSYDFHPVLPRLGFNVETPPRVEGSFYYWRPFALPVTLDHLERTPPARASERTRSLLRKRREIKYWIASAPERNLAEAIRENAWAVARSGRNTGMWRSIRPGHVVFLVTVGGAIVGRGTVVSTENSLRDGYERYPLWINFDVPMDSGDLGSVREYASDDWYRNQIHGALSPLPSEVGAALTDQVRETTQGGRMWVNPNPYLLRETTFDVVPDQAFVILPWQLRTSVLPVIRDILEKANFTVKYAGDRDGQVVFEDIWILLNESDLVIVDFTYRRPNVYLEYGMALVLGKPVVAITQNPEDIPTDTLNLKYLMYEDKLNDKALSQNLIRSIRDTMTDITRANRPASR
jgi:hypothetical protein